MRALLTLIAIGSAFGFFHVVAVGTFGVTLIEVFEIGVLGYALYYCIWLGRPLLIPMRIETYAILAVLVAMLASAGAVVFTGSSITTIQSLKSLAHFMYLWLFAFVAYCIPVSAEVWTKVLRVQLVVALFVVMYGVYQVAGRPLDWPFAWIEISNASFSRGVDDANTSNQLALQFGGFFRATSFFSEPSALAAYSASALCLLLVPLFRGTKALIRSRVWFWIILVGTMLGVFIAFSLTGILLTFTCMGICLVLYWGNAWRKMFVIAAAFSITIVASDYAIEKYLGVSVVEMFTVRVTSILTGGTSADNESAVTGESVSQRVGDYEMSFQVLKEYPIFGAGPGNFGNTSIGKSTGLQFPASSYGTVSAELGGFGIVVFASFLLILLARTFQIERVWTAQYNGNSEYMEMLLPFVPLRMLFLILIGFAGNLLISGFFWSEILMILSIQSAARRELGIEKVQELYVVSESWRTKLLAKGMV